MRWREDGTWIRVAVTRDPTQAIPMGGSFTGASNPFRGMNVEVEIKAEESAGGTAVCSAPSRQR